jgi:hypothetical protein
MGPISGGYFAEPPYPSHNCVDRNSRLPDTPSILDPMAARPSIDGPPLEPLERVTAPCYARRHERCTPQAYNGG